MNFLTTICTYRPPRWLVKTNRTTTKKINLFCMNSTYRLGRGEIIRFSFDKRQDGFMDFLMVFTIIPICISLIFDHFDLNIVFDERMYDTSVILFLYSCV